MRTASTRARHCRVLVAFSPVPMARFAAAAEPAKSQWVYPGADGKLVYKTTPAGDRIMDFSYAGYMGGGVALPIVPVKRTVEPSASPIKTTPPPSKRPSTKSPSCRSWTVSAARSSWPPAISLAPARSTFATAASCCAAAAAVAMKNGDHDQNGRRQARRHRDRRRPRAASGRPFDRRQRTGRRPRTIRRNHLAVKIPPQCELPSPMPTFPRAPRPSPSPMPTDSPSATRFPSAAPRPPRG